MSLSRHHPCVFLFSLFFFLFLFIVGVPRTGIAWLLGPPNEERKREPIKVWPTLSKLMHKEKNASKCLILSPLKVCQNKKKV